MGIFEPTEKQKAKWLKTRELGRWRFVLLYGALGWGIPWAIMFSLYMLFIGNPAASPLPLFGTNLVIGLIGGVFFGLVMWSVSERSMRNAGQSGQ